MMRGDSIRLPLPADRIALRDWVTPAYARMRAGDAEGPGPNPDTFDIGFTKS